jgi:tRNA pseudouridine55 synthase
MVVSSNSQTGHPPEPASFKKSDLEQPALTAGIFLVDKPVGATSFRMVQLVRRALNIKKVGHAGTLDPFASGLLIICAGRPATKLIDRLMAGEKEYEAVLKLGQITDTQDLEGRVVEKRLLPEYTRQEVEQCLSTFLGEQKQQPPHYSAVKHKGKPLYYYARKGINIEKPARDITIHDIALMESGGDTLAIRVVCSKGTYIRTLAHDIGQKLGCGAHLIALRRTRCGCFHVSEAVDGAQLTDREKGRAALAGQQHGVGHFLNRLAEEQEETE